MIRFGIKALLLLTLFAALSIHVYLKVLKRRQVIEFLGYQHGYKIEHVDWGEAPLRFRLLSLLVGQKGGLPVRSFDGGAEFEIEDGQIEAISQLTEMKELSLQDMTRTDFDLSSLHSLVNVEEFVSWNNGYVDAAMFRSMPKLKKFTMVDGTISGDPAVFGQLKQLKEVLIQLTWLNMTDDSFDRFCDAAALEKLMLSGNNDLGTVTDYSPLLKLKNLKELNGVLDPENPDHQKLIEALPKGCVVEFGD